MKAQPSIITYKPAEGLEPKDELGNYWAHNGAETCHCGCKYWVKDHCLACGVHVITIRKSNRALKIAGLTVEDINQADSDS